MNDDERLGLESASSAYRRRRCVGSTNLIRQLRDSGTLAPELPDPDAASGNLVHAAWSGDEGARRKLDSGQADTLASLERLEAMVVADWAGTDDYTLLGREKRLWLHQGLSPVHSGQYDVAYGTLKTQRILIIDAKTLYSEEVAPAEENAQMQELLGLAHFNFAACQDFTLCLLQPHAPAGAKAVSLANFNWMQAELCLHLLRHNLAEIADPYAPRVPGVWCKYCPALSQCAEARAELGHTHELAARIAAGEYALPVGERGAQLLAALAEAQTITKALRARYKQLLAEDPGAVPGWWLKPGKKVREITDSLKAYLIAQGCMSVEEFFGASTVAIGPLEERLGKERFAQLFAPVLTEKVNAPELAKRPKKIS